MSFKSEALDAFEQALEILREDDSQAGQLVVGSQTIDYVPGSSPERLDLLAGGFMADYSFSALCRLDDFTTPPIVGNKVSRNNRSYRILSTETAQQSPLIVLHLGAAQR